MTVYLEDFREIVERIEYDSKESEKYLDSLREVDTNLCDFIFENKYSDILYFQNQYFVRKFLGDEIYDWINWYFYDRPSCDDDKPNAWIYDVGYVVNDLDSFIDFAQHGLKLPIKPREN